MIRLGMLMGRVELVIVGVVGEKEGDGEVVKDVRVLSVGVDVIEVEIGVVVARVRVVAVEIDRVVVNADFRC